MILEAWRTTYLRSGSWRPRRAGGVLPACMQRLDKQESQAAVTVGKRAGSRPRKSQVFSLSPRTENCCCLSSTVRQEDFLLVRFPFCSIQVFNACVDEAPTLGTAAFITLPVTQRLVSRRNTLMDPLVECWPHSWAAHGPVKLDR